VTTPRLQRIWTASEPLVEARALKKHFVPDARSRGRGADVVRAVDGVDLALMQGETLALCGMPGSGKSTLARTLLRLYKPTSGQVFFRGEDLSRIPRRGLRALRREMAMVFQDPVDSINPRQTLGEVLREPLAAHGIGSEGERDERVVELLVLVGVSPEAVNRYPHQFSAGQRQRIALARALACDPSFVVLDEPLAALDAAGRGYMLDLLQRLQAKRKLTYLLICNDPDAVSRAADRVAVLAGGRLVDQGTPDDVLPRHPQLNVTPLPARTSLHVVRPRL
jgi:ABC-type glutathione transport system ATPase component